MRGGAALHAQPHGQPAVVLGGYACRHTLGATQDARREERGGAGQGGRGLSRQCLLANLAACLRILHCFSQACTRTCARMFTPSRTCARASGVSMCRLPSSTASKGCSTLPWRSGRGLWTASSAKPRCGWCLGRSMDRGRFGVRHGSYAAALSLTQPCNASTPCSVGAGGDGEEQVHHSERHRVWSVQVVTVKSKYIILNDTVFGRCRW